MDWDVYSANTNKLLANFPGWLYIVKFLLQHLKSLFVSKTLLQAEKERKIAEFQLKVKERLRAMKVREQQEKVNKTLLLTESEDLLMKSLDPVKKPPIVASSFVAINSQVLFVCIRLTFKKLYLDFLPFFPQCMW